MRTESDHVENVANSRLIMINESMKTGTIWSVRPLISNKIAIKMAHAQKWGMKK